MARIRRRGEPAIDDLHRRMEQVMEHLLHDLGASASAAAWAPRADVYETGDGLAIVLEIPGVERDRIDIVIEGSYLRVTGRREEPEASACMRWHQMEIVRGPFERLIALPHEVDASGIRAVCKDGFLVITIPRAPARARAVPIEAS